MKRWQKGLGPGSQNYERFVLLTSPRSGSTLLHTYLNSSLNIQSLGEQPWRDLEQGLDKDYFQAYPRQIRAVGFKVFYSFAGQAPYNLLYARLLQDKHLKVIHLTRENLLEQYLSKVLAWQKREWTTKNKPSTREEKVTLDLAAFEAYLHQQKIQQSKCLEDFQRHAVRPVSYEQLVQEPSGTLKDIQTFLGVPHRKLFTVLEKQASYTLSDLLENAEEVSASFPEYFMN